MFNQLKLNQVVEQSKLLHEHHTIFLVNTAFVENILYFLYIGLALYTLQLHTKPWTCKFGVTLYMVSVLSSCINLYIHQGWSHGPIVADWNLFKLLISVIYHIVTSSTKDFIREEKVQGLEWPANEIEFHSFYEIVFICYGYQQHSIPRKQWVPGFH